MKMLFSLVTILFLISSCAVEPVQKTYRKADSDQSAVRENNNSRQSENESVEEESENDSVEVPDGELNDSSADAEEEEEEQPGEVEVEELGDMFSEQSRYGVSHEEQIQFLKASGKVDMTAFYKAFISVAEPIIKDKIQLDLSTKGTLTESIPLPNIDIKLVGQYLDSTTLRTYRNRGISR